jgi:hypothetical protein
MRFVQEDRQARDLVDYYNRILRSQLLRKPAGIPAEGKKNRGVEKVIDLRVLERMADEGCLTGLPRSKEEVRSLCEETGKVEEAWNPFRRR